MAVQGRLAHMISRGGHMACMLPHSCTRRLTTIDHIPLVRYDCTCVVLRCYSGVIVDVGSVLSLLRITQTISLDWCPRHQRRFIMRVRCGA
jgi:hypothetical protein